MPTLRGLEILVAVADTGSVSRAARSLHLTQPAVSHQLTTLERELGAELVHRGSKGAVVTRRGRAVVDAARTAVAAAARVVEVARAASGAEPIRVAVAESFTLPFVLPVVSRWADAGPSRVHLSETSSASQALAALSEGTYDLVIVPGPVLTGDVHVVDLGTERVVAVGRGVAASPDALARFGELSDVDLIGVDASNGFSRWLEDQFVRAGVVYRPQVVVRSLEKAAAFADAGFGVAIVPLSAVRPEMQSADLDPPLERPILAVTRSAHDPTIDGFIASVQRHVSAVTDGRRH